MKAEVDAEAIELLYRGLEMHLKNVLSSTVNSQQMQSSCFAARESSNQPRPQQMRLTAAQIKLALEVKLSVFGEDSVSLEYL